MLNHATYICLTYRPTCAITEDVTRLGQFQVQLCIRGEYFDIIPLFWLRNSFGFLALFGKVFGKGNIVSPKKLKIFPKFASSIHPDHSHIEIVV